MNNMLDFLITIISVLIGYRLGKEGKLLTDNELSILKPRTKTKIFNKLESDKTLSEELDSEIEKLTY